MFSPSAFAAGFVARWPTGARLFLILSIALLPLAMIAIYATLQTTRNADREATAGLRLASTESGRAMAIELFGDMTALRRAVESLAADRHDAPGCARAQGVFSQQAGIGAQFVIFDRAGRAVCGTPFPDARRTATPARGDAIHARIEPGRGLTLGVAADSRRMFGAAFFPSDFLSEISQPSSFTAPYELALVQGGQRLVIDRLPRESALERRTARAIDLGIGDLMLEMRVRSTPITSSLVIALMLPMLMWAAASGISWFVVDRLMVRPLRQLRAKMAALTPGMELDPALLRALPAQEIRELASTFRALTQTVALHEAGLAEGLLRQKKLTREVHHRVKNNLQVISSLINLHARSAPTPEAVQAYASIQRRVDALAVVHRNHFAEMEENHGLGLRPMIGELAGNIRATAPDGSRIGIALDVDPYLVSQDTAVAVAFLVTEVVELALACDPQAQIHISLKPADTPDRALLCIVSPVLVESEALNARLSQRYGRVIEGLSRQLRAPMRYDGKEGSYAITIAVIGRE